MKQEYAIVRLPSSSVAQGLSIKERGVVNVENAIDQHRAYCNALIRLGLNLIVLQPEEDYPDSVFVEDPGVIVGGTYVVANLQNPARRGEEPLLLHALAPYFRIIRKITDPGFVEGGDVIITPKAIYVGISGRTNIAGAEQLLRIARDTLGLKGYTIDLPVDWLHLKGAASFQLSVTTQGAIVVCEELASQMDTGEHSLIVTPSQNEERFGANCISRGNTILVHTGCTKSERILASHGLDTYFVNLSEYAKIDGAMSCLSKIF